MWTWLKSIFSYVSTALGKLLTRPAEDALLEHGITINTNTVTDVTNQLLENRINAAQWEAVMRQSLKENYIQQYLLGVGGKNNLTQADFGSIGGMLAEQYKYLRNFAQQIENGELTPKEIMRRAMMYANSAREAWNRARGRAHGIPEGALPDYPGSGNTECLTNCKCHWEIDEDSTEWRAYWTLGYVKTEHCFDCVQRSKEWAPYIIPKVGEEEEQE